MKSIDEAVRIAEVLDRLDGLRAEGYVEDWCGEAMALFGVDSLATASTLDKRLKRLSLDVHPDKIAPLMEEAMVEREEQKTLFQAMQRLESLKCDLKEHLWPTCKTPPEGPVCARAELIELSLGDRAIVVSCAASQAETEDEEQAFVVEVPFESDDADGVYAVPMTETFDGGATIGVLLREEDWGWLFQKNDLGLGVTLMVFAAHPSRGNSEGKEVLVQTNDTSNVHLENKRVKKKKKSSQRRAALRVGSRDARIIKKRNQKRAARHEMMREMEVRLQKLLTFRNTGPQEMYG